MAEFWWVVFPYLTLGLFAVGSVVQYAYRPMTWGSPSSQLLESRWLRPGSLLFHWGIVFVFFGHVFGLFVPMSWYGAVGIAPHLYHLGADVLGGIAGIATEAGLAILILRRALNPRLRATTLPTAWLALCALFIVVGLGDVQTVIVNQAVGPYEYRLTVGPWARELFTLHPAAALMAGVPVLLQVHVVTSLVLFAVWPFTRLVHVWSVPLAYLRRAPIQYRARDGYAGARARAGGR